MVRSLRDNETGATIVEFGLLLPVILGSFLGVLQGGIGMMTYNSLRNLSAETSRFALVQYQNSNGLAEAEIESDGKARAADHGLAPSRFSISVTKPTTQRIDGAIELEITTTYRATSVLPFFGIQDFPVSFTRPIFLIDDVDNSEDGSELDDGTDEDGTDFGEGGIDDGGSEPEDPNCVVVESNCDKT